MFMGVLGHVDAFDDMRSLVDRVMAAVPSGSYLLLWDSTSTSDDVLRGRAMQEAMHIPYQLRTVEQLAQCFEGLELVEPGLVPITEWRPEPDTADTVVGRVDAYGALGRKP
jgi:hypothetical protein